MLHTLACSPSKDTRGGGPLAPSSDPGQTPEQLHTWLCQRLAKDGHLRHITGRPDARASILHLWPRFTKTIRQSSLRNFLG